MGTSNSPGKRIYRMKTKRTVKGALALALAKRKALDVYIKGLQALVKAGVSGVEAAPLPNFAPRKKPGPKPGTRRVVTKSVNGVSATIKKGKGKKGAVKSAKAAKTGSKPRLIDAIITVMAPTVGKKSSMNAVEVFAELKRRHWLPGSNDPLGYVRYTLSKEKDIYSRDADKRGHYYLANNTVSAAPAKPGPKPKAKPVPVVQAAAPVPAAPVSEPMVQAAPATPAPKAPSVVKAAAPKAAAPAPVPAPVVAAEDEDPSRVADDILASAGIDLSQDNPFST
jgi:hypothetical protein